MEIFIELYNKKYTEIGEIGYYIHYLYSNNCERKNENQYNFFRDIGNNIKTLKDFIQLIYCKEYINECSYINNDFLMKYIQYIKLLIKEDDHNCLYIKDIKFKIEEKKKIYLQL